MDDGSDGESDAGGGEADDGCAWYAARPPGSHVAHPEDEDFGSKIFYDAGIAQAS